MKQLILLSIFFCLILQLNAQDSTKTSPIIFIYDASGSMWGQMEGKTKMQIAADVLSGSVEKLPENQQVGLVAYGHRQKSDCEDVEFLIDAENTDKNLVTQSLKKIKPLGRTPLAYSATQVIGKLRDSKMKATIILVTDGIESCGGDICEVVRLAREEGIAFKLHIIGFGLKEDETEQLKCAAAAGDGQYFDAADAGALNDALIQTTTTTVDEPSGNFSVFTIKNDKPVDAYIKALKAGTRDQVKAVRTYGDTTFLYLPPGKYDFEIKPLEHSDVNAIVLKDMQSFGDSVVHQTVSFDGGKIKVSSFNNGEGWDAVVIIYSTTDGKSVARGRTYGKPDTYELDPGIYDVEIQAMVIEGIDILHRIENVTVGGNETIDVEHNFMSGVAMIGANSAGKLVDAVVKIVEVDSKKSVASARTYTTESSNPKKFILSPGTYEVSLTTLGEHKGKSEKFTMVIKAGETFEKVISF